ncbi:MAG: GNAT family N-acetyltransferase [Eubacteriales bacterium]|nr:GNAT family N-acetyltransferase [Eubacteriales bacterium]
MQWILQSKLQVSQLYLDIDRVLALEKNFDLNKMEPIPLKRLDGKLVMTDGHHRAAVLLRRGYRALPCVEETAELDWELYRMCIRAAEDMGIMTPRMLLPQLRPHEEFVNLWPVFCDHIQQHREYLKNPCAYSSLPLWKELSWPKPMGLNVFHSSDWEGLSDESKSAYLSVQRFFRLYHDLEDLEKTDLAEGFSIQELDFTKTRWPDQVGQFLNYIYHDQGIRLNTKEIEKWRNRPVFMPSLWFWIVDTERNKRVALAIVEFDRLYNEGILEWIQVLPEYRGKGLGKALVNTALCRLKSFGAYFATVSGDLDNPTKPEKLYRNCGFTGQDYWYIARK